MKPALMLCVAFATPVALAVEFTPDAPSVEGFFRQAALDRYCHPGSTSASPALEAYRAHTLEYFNAGAPASSKSVQDGAAAAVQSLKGDVPPSYLDEVNKGMAAAPPAARKSVCSTFDSSIKVQIARENLSIKMIQADR